MSILGHSGNRANEDFQRARRAGNLRRLWTRLTGQNNNLVPFEDLKQTLGILNQYYRGVQPVPLDKIIGSMGRSRDFDRVFMPTQKHSRGKWVSVDRALHEGITLPPISVYQVGDAYFVVDGHHRVSVARQQGNSFIDAEVIELKSRVPVTANLKLEDLDGLAAYQDFLERTRLDVLRPNQDVRLTMPGDYTRLLDHIRVHKYFIDRQDSQDLSWEEAVTRWYDHVYLPVIETIRRHSLMHEFPNHTEADLYLWIIEHAYYLSQKAGWQLSGWEVAKDFVERFGKRPTRLLERIKERIVGVLVPGELGAGPPAGVWREERVEETHQHHLFRDILVTLTGAETGWRALAQAAEFARLEDGVLHGLHVAPSDDPEHLEHGRRILDEFMFRCESLGVRGTTSLTVGRVDEQILDYARWSDLVVINQRREHGRWAEQPLGTIFQVVAEQAARPVLAVPGTDVLPLRRALLAYDGSPKAREALFVLRHMMTCWNAQSVILTVASSSTNREMLDAAWKYLQQDAPSTVTTRYEQGDPHEVILRVMEEERADFLLMGGYGYQPLLKAFLGSTVDRVLREAFFPVLICH